MKYLNIEHMEQIDGRAFRHAEPYPWLNPEGFLTEEGYRELLANLPDVSLFDKTFGKVRKYGQYSHDRYSLPFDDNLPVADCWKEFVDELRGPEYRRFLRRMTNGIGFSLQFHWHYTPNGCSVSPHCDAKRKLGSHIFYFNTESDWDPSWGGETLILDDKGRFPYRSAPAFEDFDEVIASESLGNRSLLFIRRDNSWHGVREIRCPEGALRKVFIVVINRVTSLQRLRQAVGM